MAIYWLSYILLPVLQLLAEPRLLDVAVFVIYSRMNGSGRLKYQPLTISQVSEIVGRLKGGENPTEIGRAMGLAMTRAAHIKQGRAYQSIIRFLKVENGLEGADPGRGYEDRDTLNNSITIPCPCCSSSPSDPK